MKSAAAPRTSAASRPLSDKRRTDLPRIVVRDADGGTDGSVLFTNWHTDGWSYTLVGWMTWNGSRVVDTITYEVVDDGVVVDGGPVVFASNSLRRN